MFNYVKYLVEFLNVLETLCENFTAKKLSNKSSLKEPAAS